MATLQSRTQRIAQTPQFANSLVTPPCHRNSVPYSGREFQPGNRQHETQTLPKVKASDPTNVSAGARLKLEGAHMSLACACGPILNALRPIRCLRAVCRTLRQMRCLRAAPDALPMSCAPDTLPALCAPDALSKL